MIYSYWSRIAGHLRILAGRGSSIAEQILFEPVESFGLGRGLDLTSLEQSSWCISESELDAPRASCMYRKIKFCFQKHKVWQVML